MKITISKKDEKEFYDLFGANTESRLFCTTDELRMKNRTITSECAEVGSYPFIPIALPYIIRNFIAIRKWVKKQNRYYIKATEYNKKSSFLDAGSGIGNVLMVAKAAKLAKHFTGIEFNKPTHKLAKKFINNKDKDFSLLLDDVLTYDNYSAFDIIYYYSPLNVGILEIHLEELIEDGASVGTIIIPKMKAGIQVHKDKRLKRIDLDVKHYKYDRISNVSFYIKTKEGKRKKSDIPGILKTRGLPPGKIDEEKLALIKKYIKERKML